VTLNEVRLVHASCGIQTVYRYRRTRETRSQNRPRFWKRGTAVMQKRLIMVGARRFELPTPAPHSEVRRSYCIELMGPLTVSV